MNPKPAARRRALTTLAMAALGGVTVAARASAPDSVPRPREVELELPGASLRGQGRLRFLGLSIYDARLWVGDGFDAAAYGTMPVALELVYARSLVGRQIAERSLEEMQRRPGISPDQGARWLAAMKGVFPDVAQGDRITGVHRPGVSARFFVNAALRGEIADAEFARRFFGIWLNPGTSQPALRQALIGGGS